MKKNINVFVFIALLFSSTTISHNQEESFMDFFKLLTKYGWDFQKIDKELPQYTGIIITGGTIVFQIPDCGGYYEELQFYILIYDSPSQIPFSNGDPDQVYPYCFSEGAFPIQNYKDLFDGVFDWEHFQYIRWNAYRQENKVYIIYANPARQNIDYIFNFLVDYYRAATDSAKFEVENKISEDYNRAKELFESYKIIQSALKKLGFYNGNIDGMFGSGSIRALQQYLKSQGYYSGILDGDYGRATKEAIKKLQEMFGLPPTGEINVETAKKIKGQ